MRDHLPIPLNLTQTRTMMRLVKNDSNRTIRLVQYTRDHSLAMLYFRKSRVALFFEGRSCTVKPISWRTLPFAFTLELLYSPILPSTTPTYLPPGTAVITNGRKNGWRRGIRKKTRRKLQPEEKEEEEEEEGILMRTENERARAEREG